VIPGLHKQSDVSRSWPSHGTRRASGSDLRYSYRCVYVEISRANFQSKAYAVVRNNIVMDGGHVRTV
jgi:hypothetical protein